MIFDRFVVLIFYIGRFTRKKISVTAIFLLSDKFPTEAPHEGIFPQETSDFERLSLTNLNVSLSIVDIFVVFDYIVEMS